MSVWFRVAALFLRQLPDSVTHDEGSGLAIVPRHQVSLCNLTMPHFGAKRRSDRPVRAVRLGIAVPGVDLLNPRAGPQRSGRLQRVGA